MWREGRGWGCTTHVEHVALGEDAAIARHVVNELADRLPLVGSVTACHSITWPHVSAPHSVSSGEALNYVGYVCSGLLCGTSAPWARSRA